jgi:hypothetical protein
VQYVPVDAHFNFHYANGYDRVQTREDGRTHHTIVLDTVQSSKLAFCSSSQFGAQMWRNLDYAATVPMSKLVRYVWKTFCVCYISKILPLALRSMGFNTIYS